MSSVKRSSNMAPSELGQPKAPDKCEANAKNTMTTAAVNIISSDIPLDAFNPTPLPPQSSSLPSKSQQQQQQQQMQQHQVRDVQKLTSSTQQDTKNIKNLDDDELKSLLDEAISYKRPKDRENKSEIFKELLQDAELEDQARDTYPYYLSARSDRGAGSHRRHHPHTQGGSLQDLVESVNNEHLLLDGDYFVSGQTRRFHQHNSRYKKYSSSVSSRQREGGSLPSNVNVSSTHHHHPHPHSFAYVDSFLPHKYPTNSSKSNSISSNSTSGGYNSKSGKTDAYENERNCIVSTAGCGINTNYHHRSVAIGADGVSYAREESAHQFFGAATSVTSSTATRTVTTATATEISHTIINIDEPDETRHLLAHDSLAQGLSEPFCSDDGTELVSIKKPRVTTMNYNIPNNNVNMDVMIGEPPRHQSNHSVEKTIQFLKCSSQMTDAAAHINSKAIAKSSSTEPKYLSSSTAKYVHLNPTQSQKQFDENCNAILPKPTTGFSLTANQPKTKPKRSNKAERNTKTWTVPEPEGSDSKYNIDSLVAFIENKEISKKSNIINVNKNVINSDRSRKEKKNTGKKDGANKLKKSTSMEELKSSSKMEEEEIAQSERLKVSLRQKQMQQTQKRNNAVTTAADGKDTNPKQQHNPSQSTQQHKRGERRSWGTEELNYLGERDANPTVRTDDEREAAKKLKDNNNGKPNSKSSKKSEQVMSANVSIESIPTTLETAEFHVVTKKKKTKKRQILEEAKAKQQMNQQARDQNSMLHTGASRNISSNFNHSGNKYHPSNSYTNDREVYLSSPTTKDNRRKSTSSVPPSDKSDSSDLDSIHSLPVESTTTCTPTISYADIARTANQPDKYVTNANVWPTVSYIVGGGNSGGKNFESPDNSNLSTCSSTVSSKSQISGRTIGIDANAHKTTPSDSSTNGKTISYVQRLLDDKPSSIIEDSTKRSTQSIVAVIADTKNVVEPVKSPQQSNAISENTKNQLQKSKSVDCEKFGGGMSLDQFPGLEKTVKPQKTHPNFVSLLVTTTATLPLTADKVNAKTSSQKKCSLTDCGNNGSNHPKDVVAKRQASYVSDEKIVDNKTAIDLNQPKLVFVQNNSKAEEIANSDSSNLFVPISASSTAKKSKKSHQNLAPLSTVAAPSTTSSSSSLTYPRNQSVAHRPAVIIFTDHETNHENVSPLLFGDFNDDILQLMKPDDNHLHQHHHYNDSDKPIAVKKMATSPPICSSTIIINSNNTFESAEHHHAIGDGGNLSKISDIVTVTSPQSDPGYSSAHNRSTYSTESLEVTAADSHHQKPHQKQVMHHQSQAIAVAGIADNSSTHVMPTEITNKYNIVTKKTNLVKTNNNNDNNKNVNKTSDVVSNQSINNNNNNLGDITFHNAVQSNSESDNYINNNSNLNNVNMHRSNNNNNNNNSTVDQQLNTKRINSIVNDSNAKLPSQHQQQQQLQTNNTNNKAMNAINSVSTGCSNSSIYKTNTKSNTSTANNYQQQLPHQGIISYNNVDSNNLENTNNQFTNNKIFNKNNPATKVTAVVSRDSNKFTPSSSSSSILSDVENVGISASVTGQTSGTLGVACGKDVQVTYSDLSTQAVSSSTNVANYNHEKVVNFVGLAWEDILYATNCGGAHYYDGQ